MRRVGVIVLAAGRSTRFADGGAHKLLARIGSDSVIRFSVRAAIDSEVGTVVVVTGAEGDAVSRELAGLPVRIVEEPGFASGMAVPLRRGVEELLASVDAVMVGLGDQPSMRAEAYRRVAARWAESGATIVVPRYAGTVVPAHPTLFDASTFDELRALRGDVGARAVIARDPSRVIEAAIDWPAPRDVDTAGDLVIATREMEPNVKRTE